MNVLIYMYSFDLKPAGGPRGYVYNLKNGLETIGVDEVNYLEDEKKLTISVRDSIQGLKKSKVKQALTTIKSIIKYGSLIYGWNHKSVVDLEQYDIVHFHTPIDMYRCRDSLKNYTGIVLLNSHSPTLSSKEIVSSRSIFEKKYCHFIYDKMINADRYAFSRADYVIFPCEEAEEPYYNNWEEFSKLKETYPEKFKYLLTGISKCHAHKSKSEFRKEKGIPEDAFVIAYVGRHNELKGYDLFKQIGLVLLKNPNIFVLVGGAESPMEGPQHERWKEIGWTNDPHSLINAADVFVLPNRETYFDLIMLEILSLGQIVVASRTGGNKFFEGRTSGVILYDNIDECINSINSIMKMNLDEIQLMKESNITLFQNSFSNNIFAKNYIELLHEIMEEKQ